MSICLCMVVKDEHRIIKRCLDSVKHFIDSWCIVDTGSTDNTADIIKQELHDIPGTLHVRDWVNFSHNRNEAIELARASGDYLLLLDADMVVKGIPPEYLHEDGYLIQLEDYSLTYLMVLLIKSSVQWQYIGSTHEYIYCATAKPPVKLSNITILHECDGSSRADKFQRDKELLLQDIAADPSNIRAAFYLAQTYRDIGDHKMAIEWYKRRVDMGGWEEERWYAQYQSVLLAPFDTDAFLRLYNIRPTRLEPLFHLIRHYRLSENFHVGYLLGQQAMQIPLPEDILFVHKEMYDWMAKDESALCAYYSGHKDKAREWWLSIKTAPPQELRRIDKNLAWTL